MTHPNDVQVGGGHYKEMGIQPWDVIDANFNRDQQIGAHWGALLAYVMRWNVKHGVEDLQKAAHTLEKLISVVQGARDE